MNGNDLITKALRAATSARLLFDAGDVDGACNRAYYAMFDAARAALIMSSAPVEVEVARTHGGLITAFSLHLVKPGRIPVELGRSLNRAEEIRLIADYRGDQIEIEQALWVVEQAARFVHHIQAEFVPGNNGDPEL